MSKIQKQGILAIISNGLEGFWGYLKRKLAAKSEIRKEKLPLYLGEYVWKCNHRKLSLKEQKTFYLHYFSNILGPKIRLYPI